MAERLCKMCRNWHDLEAWPASCIKNEPDKRGPYRIHIISDTMDPVQSQVDGKIYTSKSKMRSSYKAHNAIEVGNDPQRFARPKPPKINRQAIRASLERAKSRVALTS